MSEFESKRVVREYTNTVAFPAAEVFPLLCPVLEYKWIDSWRCQVIYTDSGVAEDNCVFVTDFPDAGRQVWTTSRYEPPRRIEFVTAGADLAMRLNIRLEERGGKTTLRWTRLYTGLTEKGNGLAEAHDEEWNRQLGDYLHRSMTHYLETGEMYVPEGRASAAAR